VGRTRFGVSVSPVRISSVNCGIIPLGAHQVIGQTMLPNMHRGSIFGYEKHSTNEVRPVR
jgi:hypothetical protein